MLVDAAPKPPSIKGMKDLVMSKELNNQVAPPLLNAALTITLSISELRHLNAYREAVYALQTENWPTDAKKGSRPDAYRKHFREQRDAAKEALVQMLNDAVSA